MGIVNSDKISYQKYLSNHSGPVGPYEGGPITGDIAVNEIYTVEEGGDMRGR